MLISLKESLQDLKLMELNQYLVPKDGTPLSGLIQDLVVSGVLLTLRDRFFDKGDYQNLLMVALPDFTSPFKVLPPSICKPKELWTRKQVISSLLLNLIPAGQDKLNLISKTKISPKEWGQYCNKSLENSKYTDNIMTESEVTFHEGQLLSGVLDKSQFGASQFGFVHSCYEVPSATELL
ncbi:PREDICTED: DNA-directed RNA polymerase I subunit RPA1-like isoform X2 [Amphimedon queenslandica]|uniref:DNA-directed RNA polymerase n=1 Tax=Amphimedon queenslandica TaxID=400682 RepID=A0AAN0JM56_AMPQE|nr:PREDICTED: DNA-directed RNA polymerase I subunit RPA1-like isoform X2 [Amphimedon queenslandica]|eukprot:XP_019857898.1 PREDICTED: DNA-directed RNA polymerase I subunit RPA1-like isoform X2 [Amphimedon queenslandica]